MLDMGFAEDLDAILEATPTDAPDGAVLGDDAGADPVDRAAAPAATRRGSRSRARSPPRASCRAVRQVAYIVPRAHKPAALERVLDMENPASALVFCRTRLEVDTLVEMLNAHGHRAEALHGGMEQRLRDRVMRGSATARRTCWSPPTSPRAGSTSSSCRTSSTTTCRRRPRPTCTASAGPDAPAAAAPRSRSPSRASTGCCAASRASPSRRSKSRTVPTVADLRARRLDVTRASLRERLLAGDLDHARVVVESLARGVRHRGHRRGGRAAGPRGGRRRRRRPGNPGGAGARRPALRARTRSARSPRRAPASAAAPAANGERARARRRRRQMLPVCSSARGGGPASGPATWSARSPARPASNRGRSARLKSPTRFSLVEVPEELADEIIVALRATKIRGLRPTVRRDRG